MVKTEQRLQEPTIAYKMQVVSSCFAKLTPEEAGFNIFMIKSRDKKGEDQEEGEECEGGKNEGRDDLKTGKRNAQLRRWPEDTPC